MGGGQKTRRLSHALFTDDQIRMYNQRHEHRNGPVVDDDPRMLRCARRNVGERPCRLEGEDRIVVAMQELNETRDHAGRNDFSDGGVAFD